MLILSQSLIGKLQLSHKNKYFKTKKFTVGDGLNCKKSEIVNLFPSFFLHKLRCNAMG